MRHLGQLMPGSRRPPYCAHEVAPILVQGLRMTALNMLAELPRSALFASGTCVCQEKAAKKRSSKAAFCNVAVEDNRIAAPAV